MKTRARATARRLPSYAKLWGKKTNHQPGYHKPVVNPTTNYGPDSRKKFCERCEKRNGKGQHCSGCSL